MKKIDFHQHAILSPVEMEKVMDKHDIEKSVVIPLDFGDLGARGWDEILSHAGMKPKSRTYKNEVLRKLASVNRSVHEKFKGNNRFVFAPWESACLEFPSSGLDPIKDGVKVVKFIPVFDDAGVAYYKQMQAKLEREIKQPIVMIHTGWGSRIEPLVPVMEAFPGRTFVLAHMAEDGDDTFNVARQGVMDKFDNVYLETSYCSSPKRIAQYVEKGYGDRMLFGSDFRAMQDESSLEWFEAAVMLARIDGESKENILYNNARWLLETR
jgi:predicted TIM-barrel fold metal-dependent hydrolase